MQIASVYFCIMSGALILHLYKKFYKISTSFSKLLCDFVCSDGMEVQ